VQFSRKKKRMQLILRRSLYVVILIAALVWIVVSADRANSSTGGLIPAPQKGFAAPNFQLETPASQTLVLSAYHGKPVLINMWATWCPPCRAEMPSIEKFYEAYENRGLIVLGVDSTVQDDPTAIIPFVKEYNLTFPILLDINGEVSHLYELRSLPTSFFIDRHGTIKEVVIGGPMSEATLRANIEEIIK
jgi:cytochrome c biogenesis protein CcmG, thiol:disulfide interchange protein DsbE